MSNKSSVYYGLNVSGSSSGSFRTPILANFYNAIGALLVLVDLLWIFGGSAAALSHTTDQALAFTATVVGAAVIGLAAALCFGTAQVFTSIARVAFNTQPLLEAEEAHRRTHELLERIAKAVEKTP